MADTTFLKPLGGYRSIIPQAGETLAELALRELGDATQWQLISWVNGLVAPYIVQDPALVGPGVVLFGTPLLVPSGSPEPSATTSDLYYTDVLLDGGQLVVADGDIGLVSGISNLAQALRNRIIVNRGELIFHTDYGCYVSLILGQGNTPQTLGLVEFYVRSSLLEDERVRSVSSCVATAVGDGVVVVATVIAVSGVTVDLEVPL